MDSLWLRRRGDMTRSGVGNRGLTRARSLPYGKQPEPGQDRPSSHFISSCRSVSPGKPGGFGDR